MQKVSREVFCDFLKENKMELTGHASPMPEFGYGDDIEYYEGGGKKAECRSRWEPFPRSEFYIEEQTHKVPVEGEK